MSEIKRAKKRAHIAVAVLLSLTMFMCISPCLIVSGNRLLNDYRLWRLERSLVSIELPSGVEIIETQRILGLIESMSNGIDFRAAMLVRGDLTEEDLLYFLEGISVTVINVESVQCGSIETHHGRSVDFQQYLEQLECFDGYFVIWKRGERVSSWFDVRGWD